MSLKKKAILKSERLQYFVHTVWKQSAASPSAVHSRSLCICFVEMFQKNKANIQPEKIANQP